MTAGTLNVEAQVLPWPGSYACVRTHGFYAWLVRRVTGSEFDHCFIVCNGGQIIQAEPSGAQWGELCEYDGCEILFDTGEPMGDKQRDIVINEAIRLLGTRYGWLDVIRLGLRTRGIQWRWLTRQADSERAMVCSQLVAKCGEAAGLDWLCGETSPAEVTPADLANRIIAARWTPTAT